MLCPSRNYGREPVGGGCLRVAAAARLQRSETPKGLLGQLRGELDRFPSAANAAYTAALIQKVVDAAKGAKEGPK